jgi:hypothetical protein
MRFAFKTAPQNTTWRDMLAVWLPGVAAGRPARIAPAPVPHRRKQPSAR